MSKKKYKILFFSFDNKARDLLDKTPFTHAIYSHIILPIELCIFKFGNYKMSSSFRKDLAIARNLYYTEEEIKNPKLSKRLEKDLARAFISHRMRPDEVFLYGLRNKGYWERKEFLSDREKTNIIEKYEDNEVFIELSYKNVLYVRHKTYFHRDGCIIYREEQKPAFIVFAMKHKTFFTKPVHGTWGRGATILTIANAEEASQLYDRLSEEDTWFVEEIIKQVPETAAWNPSSVNTVRIPAIRTPNGCKIIQPFFRTGRKGAIVDNAGGGGIFAVFDAETGIITTDGVDEHGGRYKCHPDSGLRYKGWQVPRYDELKVIVAKLIHELTSHPRYVAFDFALTDNGWVLVEGNASGQFVGQIAEHRGVRKEFLEYYFGQKT